MLNKKRRRTRVDPYHGLLRGNGSHRPVAALDGFVDHAQLAKYAVDPTHNHGGGFLLGCIDAENAPLSTPSGQAMRGTRKGRIVASIDDRPITLTTGTRQEKGTSIIDVNAFAWPFGLVSHTPKLDTAELTAHHRARVLNQDVHVLDPGGIASPALDSFQSSCNVLAGVAPDDEEGVIKRAGMVAEACVVGSASNKDTHWIDNARATCRMIVAFVLAADECAGRRHMGEAFELAYRLELPAVREKLTSSTLAGGLIARAAHALYTKPEKERGSVISTLRTSLNFMESPSMRRVLGGDGLDLTEIPKGKTTLFYGVSPGSLETNRGFIRLITASVMNAFEQSDLRRDFAAQKSNARTLFIIDEAGSLGPGFARLENAASILSGYGARLVTVWQDISQMRDNLGERWETMFANAGVQIFFGNTDNATSEYVSTRLGSTLVHSPSVNAPTYEGSVQRGETGLSYGLITHPLLTPQECAKIFAREDPMSRMLCFLPGLGPAILTKAHHHSHEAFAGMVRHVG